jgi:hypothetical protein
MAPLPPSRLSQPLLGPAAWPSSVGMVIILSSTVDPFGLGFLSATRARVRLTRWLSACVRLRDRDRLRTRVIATGGGLTRGTYPGACPTLRVVDGLSSGWV